MKCAVASCRFVETCKDKAAAMFADQEEVCAQEAAISVKCAAEKLDSVIHP